MFLRDDGYWLNYLIRTNLELAQKNKRLELATHFVHPDEISPDALDVISHLVRNGVPVYVQTPFVRGCNESGRELVELFNVLRAVGAEIHYIFMPTSPIQGNRVYWSPVSEGLAAGRYLRAHLSDRAMPHMTTATSIGKIDWNASGWAVERDAEDPQQLWIRTPYNLDYFEPFAPIMQLSERVRHNHEGTLDAQFYTEVGDEEVLAGPRGLSSSPEAFEYKLTRTAEVTAEALTTLQTRLRRDQRDLGLSITSRPCPALARQHRARVEVDCAAEDAQLELALTYVRARPEITDVVLSRKDDVLSGFSRTLEIVERFRDIPHVLAIRLRSLRLLYAPEVFNRAAVTRLAARSRLQVVRPTRIEIETQLLHSSELRAEQGKVVRELQRRGLTVYTNVPLLGYINDNEQEMLAISGVCRDKGIELTNVYVCGLPIQREHNAEFPIELNSVIDIATAVRRHGSGREVPRYILRTLLGDVDFGFAPRIFDLDDEGTVGVRLLQQDLAFFQAIDPAFQWPEGVARAPIDGVSLENQEFLFAPRGPAHPVNG
jgi:L-lysine 2,3-aminomutase